jgi:hypothetical protein
MQEKAVSFLKFVAGVAVALVVISFILPYAPAAVQARMPKY